ncbi:MULTISPECIES: hypothetical protein [Mycobacteriaceae]|uniref:Uncharacterized protein n=2 Tax=Mycolicibacterium TaxID=1866885 RepID=A0A178LJ89_MYCIR|nr:MULTISPECIES: hypothetical protein [Mycobacteriaceae]OAN31056.1 hypothetical protein A4X20_29340 [Mycolicibacterium iranicum]OPX08274.1 hypothetical protein B1790_19985 [Mycobacterium sp. AT1]TQR87991.1 hypothetical protein D8S82_02650 [Mycolicibacterium hodleri]
MDVVVNGPARDLVGVDSDFRDQVSELYDTGSLSLAACADTIAARRVGPADLHTAARVVPAAVLRLAQRQWAGRANLCP